MNLIASILLTIGCIWSAFPVAGADDVRVNCPHPGTWKFETAFSQDASGVEVIKIALTSETEAQPPKFSVDWFVPQTDIHHVWTSESTHYGIPWSEPMNSELTSSLPVYAFFDAKDRNRRTFACSESCRKVVFKAPISETKMGFGCSFAFFSVPEAPIRKYAVEIRRDSRDVLYGQAIADAVEWICSAAGIVPMETPPAAFDAVYSTWYDFHQDLSAERVEHECRIASELGLKTAIVDDGWQIDLPIGNRPWNGYRFCGDWKPGRHFPDMAAHVKRVHDMGLKYMLWYSVPFVGKDSANFARFKDKCLPVECAGGHVMDPRYPEVREFIITTYERAVKEWDIDGLKLDFIGRFTLKDGVADPAVAENYAGRDIKSIPLAVDALLTEVMRRLKALKPEILIEFRQPYVGPAIRRYGNMLRATDCPLSMVENRTRIARLRLTSGKTAVHSDMLEWRNDETPESAARCILNSIFGVVQYSVHLDKLPAAHREMLAHWIRFAEEHKGALVRGSFRARYPAVDYPLLEGESASERVIGVYQENLAVNPGTPDRETFILNGANAESLVVDLPREPARIEVCDTFGRLVEVPSSRAGLRRLKVPRAGFVRILWEVAADSNHSPVVAQLVLKHRDVSLNDGWTADGAPVTLPHCWNVEDGTDGPTDLKCWNHDSVAGTGYARRKVVYRRELPPSEKTRWLRINAASIHAVVRVDGREVGRHAGAFTAFTVEVPRGGKVVEIEVDNFYDPNVPPVCGDFTMYGGLYRGVDLLDEPETFPAPTDLPTYEFRGDGFYVNGVKTFLKGVCYHQDREGKGWAISAEDEEEDIRLIKAMGANAIRTSHYPRSEKFYDLCDKYGLYVWTEIPLVDATTASETFRSNTLQVAREMVLQHRHHKCIAMWGIFNELYLKKMPDGQAEPLVREVKELIRSLDPRPIVAASNNPKKIELNAIPDALGFNMYPGWYGGKSADLGREIEEWRTANGRPCVAISEYGAGGSLGQMMPSPDYRPQPGGRCHPVDYQLKHHQASWAAIKANSNVWGCFVWVMFDAGSDNRHEGARDGINDKGLVGFDHQTIKPTYEFYAHEWGKSP